MLIQAAEESFKMGRRALEARRRKEAMAMFEAAIELERRFGTGRPQPRYLSFYGLCLGLEKNELREALRFCREAVTLESYNADIRCNLGRVLLRAGRRKEAYAQFAQGLRLQPDHRALKRALTVMGVRRPPVLPFLSRRHPINVVLGRIRPRPVAA